MSAVLQRDKSFAWETPPELWRGLHRSSSAWQGTVVALYIAPQPSQPMISVSEVRAFADRGLEGDRFFKASWSAANRPDKAVSLIEQETLEAAAAELGTAMVAEKTRRNIVTCGVPLRELLDREFTVGQVVMRGIRLFEPCGHMEKLSNLPGIFQALAHRSGLKAAIVSDGVIRVNDPIVLPSLTHVVAPPA
jgi:MOSC domain-containing protein YiiM